MKKYLKIHREFLRTSFNRQLSFRMNFSLQTLMGFFFLVTSFLAASFIFDHVENIGLWEREEFFLFLSFVLALDQTYTLLFAPNFWNFAEQIRIGELDFQLLKPAHSLFVIFTRVLGTPALITAFISYSLLIYFGFKVNIAWFQWLLLPFLLSLGLALLLALEIFISLLNFFTVEGSGVNFIRLRFQDLQSWPDFIYKNPTRKWLFPFLAVTSVPGRFLMDFSYWNWLLFMLGGTIFLWALLLLLWPRALRLYKSPSS